MLAYTNNGRSDNLAQASGSCLNESIRKPTQVLQELSLRRQAPILSESSSCSSVEVSPKKRGRASHCSPLLELSPRRKELA
ncbi:hypothetical protein DEO72_LG10g2515 [Vigna unguiculata]|uniref:Uncharacterized protein n=1 Tax=Vigna unguiculata TaxID=3917 RepID=A0A4D6NEG7_VIGUN|nr:hypothetical protein DEO72_LG10g2515 [Vigna unguiculata]